MSAAPITVESVRQYLAQRGIEVGARPRVHAMLGGVSGSVLLVESDRTRLVVKQALDQLLVEDPWFAKPERAHTEAAALNLLHGLTARCVPELIDADDAVCALVMTAAPADWRQWKSHLLTSDIDQVDACATARTLGSVLGTWHGATASDAAVAERFDDYEAFEQLRVHPFHRTILTQHPTLGGSIEACIADLTERRECLVHGDFSPKNILVDPGDPGRLWVLDFEVAHYGAAVFDLAFLLSHLLLKAVHRPGYASTLGQVAGAFLSAYSAEVGRPAAERATRRLGWHTACLALARVDGTSPAGYLSAPDQNRVRELATVVLNTPDRPITAVWALLADQGQGVGGTSPV